jgi:long-subunit fatty acid transport protein
MRKLGIFVICMFCISNGLIKAQYIEDATRYMNSNAVVTARSGALGVANYGISDDASAMYYNPAGLMFIAKSEVNLGMAFTNTSVDARLFDSINNFSINSQYLSNFSIVSPMHFKNKNLFVVGASYFMENDFDISTKFSAFNKNNITMIQEGANYKDQYLRNLNLADVNFVTKYKDSLQQTGYVRENGGINNLVGAIGFTLSEDILGGISVTGKWGKYNYLRIYNETDVLNKFNTYPDHLESFKEIQNITQEFGGFNLGFGVIAKINEYMRVSAKIQTPTWYEFTETYKRDAEAIFDANQNNVKDKNTTSISDGQSTYNLKTPFVYSAGLSGHFLGLTLAAGVEYQDAAQLEYSKADSRVLELNQQFQEQLRGLVKWGVAGEYAIPLTGLIVRASYEKRTSPFKEILDRIYTVSAGLGWVVDKNIRIDANYRISQFSDKYFLYGNVNYYYTYSPSTVSLGLTYRY